MTTQTPQPIQTRVALSSDEWIRLRQIAIEEGRPTSQVIADALRKTYPSIERQTS